MSAETDYLDATVTALVTVFDYDETEMKNLIRDNSGKAYLRYAKQLSYDQKEAFEQYQSDTNLSLIHILLRSSARKVSIL